MIEDELLRLLRRIARKDLDQELYSIQSWPFPDGKEKLVSEVTEEDVASMEPRERQSWYEDLYHHEMAERGYLLLDDGELAH